MNKLEIFLDSIVAYLPAPLEKIARRYRQMWVYVFIGCLGLVVDLGIFYFLFNVAHFDKGLANLISSLLAIFHNFVMNALFNFKKSDRFWWRLLSYYSIGIVGIGITQLIFIIFTDNLGISANIIKPISIVFVFMVQYNLNKRISFR